MKAKRMISIVALVVCSASMGLYAQSESVEGRPVIGILLDTAPLPDLLVKHLGLSPDQGIRIQNVHRGGPADKAGLERDDIIIRFEGEDVVDNETFVDEIRKAGVGTEVSLEIIHLGKRKSVTLTLEALEGGFDFKYPPEPEIERTWRPGKIFRLRPGDEDWMEVLKDGIPPELDIHINRFFDELYTYHHSTNGEDYTITIEGNPNEEDSKITVEAGEDEFQTTVGAINKLPEKYREPAEQAVKNARRNVTKRRSIKIRPDSWQMPDDWKSYLDKIKPYRNFQIPPLEPGGPMFDRIQKQMKELQRRLDRLEKRYRLRPDSQEPEKEESQDRPDSPPTGKGDQKSA